MAISERTAQPGLSTATSRASGLLITDAACPPAVRQAYQQTFLNTRFALLGCPGDSLLISAMDATASAAPLAANLAILAAQEGQHVVLVDADPYTPTLHTLFQLAPRSGFLNLIRQDSSDALGALQETEVPRLRVLGAGDEGHVPGGLGRARGLREVLLRLKNHAERLILVGAPILSHVDSLDLCGMVEGVVVTMTPGKTHREDAARAREVLNRVQAPLLGVVLTQA